ncbi:hypothetical protein DXT99_15445 [Pontibacter diazotrophicus]|uniref:Uncharacterized protein n=1 Tax=Pontibacter diazotrophicus TaxID=1400979 RepID=A0A3D8L9U8_9BACT|nr:hypothetical protein [Pontibacter diazotrophicus]RDV14185.1 hypothetical protein DXT99_15445 [Pontibacter diazotrophicus]
MLEYSMFERLPFRSQAESLAKDGTILAQRTYKEWQVTLYSLNGLFVELWAGKEAQVISTFKKTANAVAVLDPYIDDIDVQDFMDTDM